MLGFFFINCIIHRLVHCHGWRIAKEQFPRYGEFPTRSFVIGCCRRDHFQPAVQLIGDQQNTAHVITFGAEYEQRYHCYVHPLTARKFQDSRLCLTASIEFKL